MIPYGAFVYVIQKHLDGSFSVKVHEHDDVIIDRVEEVVAVYELKDVFMFEAEVDAQGTVIPFVMGISVKSKKQSFSLWHNKEFPSFTFAQ